MWRARPRSLACQCRAPGVSGRRGISVAMDRLITAGHFTSNTSATSPSLPAPPTSPGLPWWVPSVTEATPASPPFPPAAPTLGRLKVQKLGRGFAWEDAGTHDSLIQAGELIRTYEQRQGLRIGCLEEIAFENGWIDRAELRRQGEAQGKSEYGQYLRNLALAGQD